MGYMSHAGCCGHADNSKVLEYGAFLQLGIVKHMMEI
jgi:hypothetical protein